MENRENKKAFEAPKADVIIFDTEDIITTSIQYNEDDPYEGGIVKPRQ